MNIYNIVLINIGIPTIVYYVVALVVLTFLYHKKLTPFFAVMYSLTILIFVAFFWEVPMIISYVAFGKTLIMSFISFYCVLFFAPLPLFLMVYNIKITYNMKKIGLIGLAIIASVLYSTFFPQSLYSQFGNFSSLVNMTDDIPRTFSLVALTYLCYPDVSRARFMPLPQKSTWEENND